MPTERYASLEEVARATKGLQRWIGEIIIHHTWKPTAANYRGIETVASVRRYHMGERGWSDNGYHIMIGPPGDIFLCRPMERAGAHTLGHNAASIGIAYIADFDSETPDDYDGLVVGQRVVAMLLDRFKLTTEDIHFHREFANKSCPGLLLLLDRYRAKVESLGDEAVGRKGKIILNPNVLTGESRVVGTYELPPGVVARVALNGDHMVERDRIYLKEV